MNPHPPVYILATCRNPELFRATTLVFDSIRTGFPKSDIRVYSNGLSQDQRWEVENICNLHNIDVVDTAKTIHHDWIKSLLAINDSPFFICDTDVIFWDKFEDWNFDGVALAGRFVRRFNDPVTGCITNERLHTALMRMNPTLIRDQLEAYKAKTFNRELPFYSEPDFITPQYNVNHGIPFLHDTTGMLFHAIGGQPFNEAQLDCFDHIHCGTYSDIASKSITSLRVTHQKVFSNPKQAKGCWRNQEEKFYKALAI